MANPLKRSLISIRAKALSSLMKQVSELEARVEALQNTNQTALGELMTVKALLNTHSMSGTIPISEDEIVSKIFSGLKICLDPHDIAVVPHLALDGIWEAQITTAWLQVQQPQSVVLDIGANFGYYGALAAQNINRKKSKVIFFEANPNLIPYIDKTLSMNWLNEGCIVENLGISDVAGQAQLNILKDYIGCSSMHSIEHLDSYLHDKMHLETSEVIIVDTISIDEYCEQKSIPHIDLIKLDIEGYEEKAYQGMRKIVKKSPNLTLFVEFTKDSYDNPEKFYNSMLKDFGRLYTINQSGQLVLAQETTYHTTIEGLDDWVMLVFSKRDLST